MRRVVVESPYAGEIERNVWYARAAIRDSLLRGETPIASHLLYTQAGILRDEVPEERALGIRAGLVWSVVAWPVFYVDLGWSSGMKAAADYYVSRDMGYEIRALGEEWISVLSQTVSALEAEAIDVAPARPVVPAGPGKIRGRPFS
jgi:hypothetical protein